MTSSRTRLVQLDDAVARNQGTRVAALNEARTLVPRVRSDELQPQWQDVLDRVQLWRSEHPEGEALAVIVRQGNVVDGFHFDVTLRQIDDEPVAVVLGRHTQCDIEVRTTHASLRHAAIIGWPALGETDEGRASVVDLRSELGLALPDGRTARRLSSTSALQFYAATVEVTVLFAKHDAPFSVRWADQLEAELAGALVDELGGKPRPPAAAGGPAARSGGFGASDGSAASSWEKSVVIRTCVAGMPQPVVHESQIGVRCSRAAVERGVVLGRYERCDRTTAIADDGNVSRVHALVLAARDALWVVDTASSGGTRLLRADGTHTDVGEGKRIARLPNDAKLLLAGTEAVLVLDA